MTLPRNDAGDPSGPRHPSASDVAGWLGGEPRHIHLIGLAGTGISALAMILVELGHHVSGSDQRSAPVLDRLVEAGAVAHVGHDPGHVEGADLVICSTAIRADHPERVAATSAGLPVLTRADALAGLTPAAVDRRVGDPWKDHLDRHDGAGAPQRRRPGELAGRFDRARPRDRGQLGGR